MPAMTAAWYSSWTIERTSVPVSSEGSEPKSCPADGLTQLILPPASISTIMSWDRSTIAENQRVFDRSASRSEEHTSELQSLMRISYAVFCLKKKKKRNE